MKFNSVSVIFNGSSVVYGIVAIGDGKGRSAILHLGSAAMLLEKFVPTRGL